MDQYGTFLNMLAESIPGTLFRRLSLMVFVDCNYLRTISSNCDTHLVSGYASVLFAINQLPVLFAQIPVCFIDLNISEQHNVLLIVIQDSEQLRIPVLRCCERITAIL